jgi:hypothetical protein
MLLGSSQLSNGISCSLTAYFGAHAFAVDKNKANSLPTFVFTTLAFMRKSLYNVK